MLDNKAESHDRDSVDRPALQPFKGRPHLRVSLKRMSLSVLVLQNSLLVLAMHQSRNTSTGGRPRYLASTAVLLVEIVKLLASLALAARDAYTLRPDSSASEVVTTLCHKVFAPDCWKLLIPAVLYTLQNLLVYEAVSNLDPVTFLVIYQLKILTTVFFSVIILGRTITPRQWFSLTLLTLGVALVQVSEKPIPGDWHERLIAMIRGGTMNTPKPAALRGVIAVIAASIISGLTCVYFERLVKVSAASVSLWIRNAQLSFFSLFPALFVGVLWQDGAAIRRVGFFVGYNPLVWLTIVLQAFGGLVVAVCITYADNVAKNFAASLSIVVSYAMTALIFGTPLAPHVRLPVLSPRNFEH
ncbi:hypothetical protein VTH82DRAFT_1379 [Thermothelomyces myriococcoides]